MPAPSDRSRQQTDSTGDGAYDQLTRFDAQGKPAVEEIDTNADGKADVRRAFVAGVKVSRDRNANRGNLNIGRSILGETRTGPETESVAETESDSGSVAESVTQSGSLSNSASES